MIIGPPTSACHFKKPAIQHCNDVRSREMAGSWTLSLLGFFFYCAHMHNHTFVRPLFRICLRLLSNFPFHLRIFSLDHRPTPLTQLPHVLSRTPVFSHHCHSADLSPAESPWHFFSKFLPITHSIHVPTAPNWAGYKTPHPASLRGREYSTHFSIYHLMCENDQQVLFLFCIHVSITTGPAAPRLRSSLCCFGLPPPICTLFLESPKSRTPVLPRLGLTDCCQSCSSPYLFQPYSSVMSTQPQLASADDHVFHFSESDDQPMSSHRPTDPSKAENGAVGQASGMYTCAQSFL